MSLAQTAAWLDQTGPSLALKQSALAIPLIQSVHILAVTLVVSGAVLLTARAWNLTGGQWSLDHWARPLLARMGWAVGVLAASGSLLILAEPTRELTNIAFQAKIVLLIPAIASVLWLRTQVLYPRNHPLRVRAATALVLGFAVTLVGLGRWIAYA